MPARPRTRPATLVLLAMLAAACGEDAVPAPSALPPATAACTAAEAPPLQGGSHLIGDAEPPVAYSSVPATSGWHRGGALPDLVAPEQAYDDARIVALLEAGHVVAVLGADVDPADRDALVGDATGPHADRLGVVAYEGDLPAPIMLAGWGVLQACTAHDALAVTTFVLTQSGTALAH